MSDLNENIKKLKKHLDIIKEEGVLNVIDGKLKNSNSGKRFSNYSRGTFENGLFRTWHLGVFRNSFIYLSFLFLSFSLSKLLLIGIVLFHFLRVISYLRKTKWYLLASLSEKVIDFYYLTFILVIIDFSTYKGIFDSFLKTTKTY